jgi:hypothetical protein
MTTPLIVDQRTEWGYHVVQHQPRNRAFAISYEMGFEKNPPDSGFNFDIDLEKPIQVTGVFGNLCIQSWGADTNGSIVAVLYAMGLDGDVPISWVKASQMGKGSLNVPVNVVFPNAIPANALRLGWYVDQPGAQTISAGLILSCRPRK